MRKDEPAAVAGRVVQRGAELGRKLRRGLEAERRGRGEMVAEIERTAELQAQVARQTVADKQRLKDDQMWPRASTTRIKLTGPQRRQVREIELAGGGGGAREQLGAAPRQLEPTREGRLAGAA